MAYKTILVHVDESAQLEKRVEVAAGIALHEQGVLVAVAATGERAPGNSAAEGNDAAGQQRAAAALARAEAVARAVGLSAFEKRLVDGDTAQALCNESLYADLVVLGQPASGEQLPGLPALPASSVDFLLYVVLNCAGPVLIVPAAGRIFSIGDRILIGWNGTLPAAHAIRNALPFLAQAKKVQLAVLSRPDQPDGPKQAGENSIARISGFLSRRNVKAQLMHGAMGDDAGQAMLALASDLTSDLIVMGCAAHPRGRRLLPGGATRVALETTTVPILMSH